MVVVRSQAPRRITCARQCRKQNYRGNNWHSLSDSNCLSILSYPTSPLYTLFHANLTQQLAIMLRRTGPILRSCMRQVHTHATASPARKNGYAIAAGLAVGGTAIWYTVVNPTFNDATLIVAPPLAQLEARKPLYPKTEDPNTLHTLAWGSNRYVNRGSS